MIRLLRPFLCLALALLFAVTTVGWSVASARMANESSSSHHAAGKKTGMSQQGDDTSLSDMSCHQQAPCSGEDHEGEAASTCCALACHVADETRIPFLNARAFVIAIKRAAIEPGLPMSVLSLLDRPPRPADAPVG